MIDEAAQLLTGSVPVIVVGCLEQAAEILDRAAIVLGNPGMQGDDLAGAGLLEQLFGRLELGLGFRQGRPNLGELGSAFGDRAQQAVDLPLSPRASPFGLVACAAVLGGALGRSKMIFADYLGDDVRREQLAGEAAQHPLFEERVADHVIVGAVTEAPVAAATPQIARHDADGSAAATTPHQAREQPPRPALMFGPDTVEPAPAGGHRLPGRFVDDPQLGRGLPRPLFWRPGLDALAAGLGVDRAAGAAEDDHPAIQLVLQDSVGADPVAVDGRGGPGAAGRSRHALTVEAQGDVVRASAGQELGEDAADESRLFGIDLAQPSDRLPGLIEARDPPVAVSLPARAAAGEDSTGLAAADLVGEILAEQRGHRALQADVKLADRTLAGGVDGSASEGDALEDGGDVFLVARQAVDRFRDHNVASAGGDRREKGVEARPFADGAADRIIGEDVGDGPALAAGELAADPHLVVDRRLALQRGRITGVDQRAHGVRTSAAGWG